MDELLIPGYNGQESYPLSAIVGISHREGLGMGPLYFIESRGPYQHGGSVSAMRWRERKFRLMIQESVATTSQYDLVRRELFSLLSPSRSFNTVDGIVRPLVYRRWLDGGATLQGGDAVVEVGSRRVTSKTAGFLTLGGLGAGNGIYLDGAKYIIGQVRNDGEIILEKLYGGSTSGEVSWRYTQVRRPVEIECLLERGLEFVDEQDERPVPHGYVEMLRFKAHNPFFLGQEQTRIWELPEGLGDLVFDNSGAWFGQHGVSGRWVYDPFYVSEVVALPYLGDEVARPVLKITGPATTPKFTNSTVGSTISLSYNVSVGEQVTIDVAQLSVTNNRGENLLGFLRGNLSRFGLFPEAAAPGGVNEMVVTFGDAVQASSASITWRNNFIGV